MKGSHELLAEEIYPKFEDCQVPIVLSCSEYFSLYGAVYLKSLLAHSSPNNFYDILIFTKDLTPRTEKDLEAILQNRPNISIRFVDIKPYIAKYQLKTHSHFGVESYFRLLMPYILNQYDYACYSDCDMVLKRDIAELTRIDIGDAYLGGCLDSVIIGAINDPHDRSFGAGCGWNDYCQSVLGMTDPYRYLNSGVLIFNLSRFRKEFSAEYLLEFVQEKKFYLLDQDALNALCSKDIVVIDHAWNMTNDNGGYKIPYICKAPEEICDSYFDARLNPATVHYADKFKPWKNPNEDLGHEFWRFARDTLQYERILSRMSMEMMERLSQSVPSLAVGVIAPPSGVKGEWKRFIKHKSAWMFPYGSKRRECVKRIYRRLRK